MTTPTPAGGIENLDKLMTDILPEPDGLAARYAGMVDGKLCIVAVWDSRAHAESFMAHRLGPALRQLLGTEPAGPPHVRGLDVEHCYVRWGESGRQSRGFGRHTTSAWRRSTGTRSRR